MTDPSTRRARVNSATLLMGVTGSGKSCLLATLARWVWQHYHKVALLYTTDGGGYPAYVQSTIDKGIMRVWRLRSRGNTGSLSDSLSFETLYRASLGWWPAEIDPETGDTPPNVRLVPPVTERYEMYCPAGHLVKTVAFQHELTPTKCPECAVHVTVQNMRAERTTARTKGLEQVGAVFFDSLTSMQSWQLSDLSLQSGQQELGGEKSALGGIVKSGDMRFGGNSRAHVGFAQTRAEEIVLNSLAIPGLVVPPVFTALTMEASDEGGLSIMGPKLAGRARTDEAPQWFGNTLETRVDEVSGRRMRRLYCSEWVDNESVRHLCKHRGFGGVPPILEDPDTDPPTFTQFNLGYFFELLDRSVQAVLADDEALGEVPGLAASPASYGEKHQSAPRTPSTLPAERPVATSPPAPRATAAVRARRPAPPAVAPPAPEAPTFAEPVDSSAPSTPSVRPRPRRPMPGPRVPSDSSQ